MRTLFAVSLLSSCTFSSVPSPIPPLHVGDRAVFSDAEFVLVSAVDRGPTLPTTDGGDSVTTNGRYVDVRFSVKNKTAAPTSSLFVPLMVDSASHTYSALAVGIAQFYMAKDALEYRWHEIQPGEELQFEAIYDVDSPTAKDLHLEVSGAPGETRTFTLGL